MSNTGQDLSPIDNMAISTIIINIVLVILLIPFNLTDINKLDQQLLLSQNTVNTKLADLSTLSFSNILGSFQTLFTFFGQLFSIFTKNLTFIGLSFSIVLNVFLSIPLNLGLIWITYSSMIISLFIIRHAGQIIDRISGIINAIGSLIPL